MENAAKGSNNLQVGGDYHGGGKRDESVTPEVQQCALLHQRTFTLQVAQLFILILLMFVGLGIGFRQQSIMHDLEAQGERTRQCENNIKETLARIEKNQGSLANIEENKTTLARIEENLTRPAIHPSQAYQ